MNLFGISLFQSREEAEKERLAFAARVFPLGLAQRDCARAVLRELFPQEKHDTLVLFEFISAKDVYMQNEQSAEGLQRARQNMKKLRLNKENKEKILALVVLDAQTSSLDAYPSAQDVLAYIQNPK